MKYWIYCPQSDIAAIKYTGAYLTRYKAYTSLLSWSWWTFCLF